MGQSAWEGSHGPETREKNRELLQLVTLCASAAAGQAEGSSGQHRLNDDPGVVGNPAGASSICIWLVMRARHSSAHTLLVLLAAESVVLAVAGMGRGVGVSSPQDKLVLRGGGAGNEAHSLPIRGPGTVPGSSNSSAPVGVADGQGSFQTAEEGSCEGFAGDGKHPHPAEMPEQTPGDLMGRMVGAMVTVNLKIGPQLCGRLQTIDAQMNMLLGRPVQQWVNGTVRL